MARGPRLAEFPNHETAARIAHALPYAVAVESLNSAFFAILGNCKRSSCTGAPKDNSSRESLPEPFHCSSLGWTFLLSLNTCIMRVKIAKWEPEKFVLVRPFDLARRKCFTVSWSWWGVGYLRDQVRCRRLCDAVD